MVRNRRESSFVNEKGGRRNNCHQSCGHGGELKSIVPFSSEPSQRDDQLRKRRALFGSPLITPVPVTISQRSISAVHRSSHAFFSRRAGQRATAPLPSAAALECARPPPPACRVDHVPAAHTFLAHTCLVRRAPVHRLELPPLAAGKGSINPKQRPQSAAQPCARQPPRLLGSFPCSGERERPAALAGWLGWERRRRG